MNPDGFCLCGCGQTTPIATHNKTDRGYYKGEHVRYMPGHRARMAVGESASRWKGGRYVDKAGYVHILLKDDPAADPAGYVLEHRHLMAQHLGRPLERRESVHHLNGIRHDNRIENMVVCRSHSEHMRLHHRDAAKNSLPPEQRKEAQAIAGKLGAEARWRGHAARSRP